MVFADGLERTKVVHPGDVLQTQIDQHLSVRLESGVVIGVGPESQIVLHSEDHVLLEIGQAYVDATVGQLKLHTPHLQVVDIGTIYQIRATNAESLVMMREGRVELAFANQQLELESGNGLGEFVRVLASGELTERGEVKTTDSVWGWYKEARKPLPLNGLSVRAYVQWLAQDNGIELTFRTPAVAQQAELEQLSAANAQTTDTVTRDKVLETTTGFVIRELDETTWLLDFRRE